MSEEQEIVIIAGPNGAGKTTFAREFLVREAAWMLYDNSGESPQNGKGHPYSAYYLQGWKNKGL